jgi:type II secretory pathway component PulF
MLAPQLVRVADRRLDALERRLDLIGTLAEPLLVLVVGAVVGAVVAALYLPSFRVLELV